jgi:hypothetical protein
LLRANDQEFLFSNKTQTQKTKLKSLANIFGILQGVDEKICREHTSSM